MSLLVISIFSVKIKRVKVCLRFLELLCSLCFPGILNPWYFHRKFQKFHRKKSHDKPSKMKVLPVRQSTSSSRASSLLLIHSRQKVQRCPPSWDSWNPKVKIKLVLVSKRVVCKFQPKRDAMWQICSWLFSNKLCVKICGLCLLTGRPKSSVEAWILGLSSSLGLVSTR